MNRIDTVDTLYWNFWGHSQTKKITTFSIERNFATGEDPEAGRLLPGRNDVN